MERVYRTSGAALPSGGHSSLDAWNDLPQAGSGTARSSGCFRRGFRIIPASLSFSIRSNAFCKPGDGSIRLCRNQCSSLGYRDHPCGKRMGISSRAFNSIGPGAVYIGTQSIVFLLLSTGFKLPADQAFPLVLYVLAAGMFQTLFITVCRLFYRESSINKPKPKSWKERLNPARGARLALHTVRRNALRRQAEFWSAVRISATIGVSAALSRLSHDHHNYWMPMTTAIILQQDMHQTYIRALSRTGGTIVGVGLATALAAILRPNQPELLLLTVGICVVCLQHVKGQLLSIRSLYHRVHIIPFIVCRPAGALRDRHTHRIHDLWIGDCFVCPYKRQKTCNDRSRKRPDPFELHVIKQDYGVWAPFGGIQKERKISVESCQRRLSRLYEQI